MPAPDPNTPAGRLAASLAGKQPAHLCENFAQDLAAVAAAVPAGQATDVTRALALGAAGAVVGLTPARAALVKVHNHARDLAALLEAAGVVAQ